MPSLNGFASPIFLENVVNNDAQLIDADVVFTDSEEDFDGGALTVSGLLAEDTVSIRNEGTAAGQIGLSGSDVTYGGVIIGSLAGGVGATLTVTFNAAATSEAIDALIQNLTYANSSDTPTASRTLNINVTDSAGQDLVGATAFSAVAGASNPFDLIDSGFHSRVGLGDFDDDGDLDLVLGDNSGTVQYFENTGTSGSPLYTARTGAGVPFDGLNVGGNPKAFLADVDGDGDTDVLFGLVDGTIAYYENTGTAAAAAFTVRTGVANPFDGMTVTSESTPTLADIDNDGDLDLFVGDGSGGISFFENIGTSGAPTFTARTGAANPFDGGGFGNLAGVAFFDRDGDGDLDAIIGRQEAGVLYYENTGSAAAPVFAARTGVDNPFDGVNVGSGWNPPTTADVDGDGDVDVIFGDLFGTLVYYQNTAPHGQAVNITVTAENDAPEASGLPTDVTVTEDVASDLDLSAITLTDADTAGDITVVLTASAGTMTATSGGGVTVAGSGTGAITLTGTATAIDAFLNTASAIQYTGALNASGDDAATVTITADDGSGAVELGVVNIDITAVNDPMSLTGFATAVAFNENTVNATPQLLDADVSFSDVENDFDGGALTVSGLLAEDTVSVRDQGSAAGQIGLSGSDVTYGGVIIGTLAGGVGATLTVTFNAAATSEAIDALIQNLTYANSSDTPTASRDLVINVTDAADEGLVGEAAFIQRTGAANPFNGVDVGGRSTPVLADLDGDGDLDAVVGEDDGVLNYFENTGTVAAPVFTLRSGAASPLNGIDVGRFSSPSFADLDGDGDLDAIVGDWYGYLHYFENTGTAAAPAFTQRTGGANPFNGVDVGNFSTPTFVDLDGDGDLDAVVGEDSGRLFYFANTGTAVAPVFTQRTGGANPLNGIDPGFVSAPTFADVDGDGDLDLMVGENGGALFYFENTGTAGAPAFTARTGAVNPFNGIDLGDWSAPAFGDLDNDGDIDLIGGANDGTIGYVEGTTLVGRTVTVTVTAQNDAPTATGLPSDVTVTEDIASDLDLSAVTLADVDTAGDLTVVLTASDGTMAAADSGGVTVAGSGTGAITLTGTAAAIDAFLNTASAIQYTGALNANGDDAATVTITADDGSGSVTLGVVNVDITAVNDIPTATDLPTDVTVTEDVASDLDLSAVTLTDVDTAGDLVVVLTASAGTLTASTGGGVTVTNSGTGALTLTGTASAIDTFLNTASAIQYTGALNASGDDAATVTITADDGSGSVELGVVNVDITPVDDAPIASGLPTDVTVTEDVASDLDLSAVTVADVDTAGDLTVVLTASAGTMTATSGGGVTVAGSGTGAITLTGTAAAIDAFLNIASAIQYTGALNASGDDAATVTITADDGSGAVELGVVNVDITPVDDPMSLTGLAASVTFDESTVNAAPQLLDADVTFAHGDEDYDGGALTVSGLLAEDAVSVRNEGSAAGQIGLSGSDVTYSGVIIGTLAGGVGATLTVTFNAAATSDAIDALIQNLTYANSSDTPTASRDLLINITDSAGNDLGAAGDVAFTLRSGDGNPFGAANTTESSAPALADLDGDGDADLVLGGRDGAFQYFENIGTSTSPMFVERTGSDNPLDGVDVGEHGAPAFGDLDNDGDQDLLIANQDGDVVHYLNVGSAASPSFVAQTGGAVLIADNFGSYATPTLGDLDADGDLDLIIGMGDGPLRYFQNTGTASAPVFTEMAGPANPLDGVTAGSWQQNWATPALADGDGDGDLDLIVGGTFGAFRYFENTGTTTAPVFEERTGGSNPLSGTRVNFGSYPTLVDLDGDGDFDLVSGDENSGVLTYFENTTPRGQTITVTVTAEDDAPTATGLPTDLTVTEDVASALDLSAMTLSDPDTAGDLVVVLTASAGTLTASDGGGVTVTGSGTGAITLTGTAAAIDAFLNTDPAIQYTGALNASGDDAATVTITADDGSGAVELGEVNIDITPVNDAPAVYGLPTDLTVTEDVASALDLSAMTLSDPDTAGDLVVVLTASAGTLTASDAGGVTVTGSGTGAITLTGTAAAIDAFLNAASAIQYTGALNANGDDAATVTITADDGSGAVELGVVNIDITPVNDPIDLTGFTSSVSFDENTVNATPQLLDVDVTFSGGEGFDGGTLTLTGLLAEDAVSVRNEGVAAGQIGLNGANVSYGGVTIATLTGGAGSTLTITFNAAASSEAVDALIQNLTYANSSDTPTGSRDLRLNINDAAGNDLGGAPSGQTITVTVTAEDELPITGGPVGDVLDGTAAGETILGLGGNDWLNGMGGDDVLEGGDGNDVLRGGAGADELQGGSGDDIMNGGSGADVMIGGTGDDLFYVYDEGDVVTDAIGEGDRDRVVSSVSYTLDAGAEIEIFSTASPSGDAAINLTGNAFSQRIRGNDGDNRLDGRDGDDILWGNGGSDTLLGGDGDDDLYGGTGSDRLEGGAGADYLDGGTGADRMDGGLGDDRYYVDDAGDVIIEDVGEGGLDRVWASVSYTLAAGVGVEVLSAYRGTAAIDLTGNAFGQRLKGNDGANTLTGGAGEDFIFGAGGVDSLFGGAGRDILDGGAGADTLSGGEGDDRIEGGDGYDTVLLSGVQAEYRIRDLGNGRFDVTDLVAGRDGNDRLTGVEQLQFSDGTFLVLGGEDAPVSANKDANGPQILPGLGEDDFVVGKDDGLPWVLPGTESDLAPSRDPALPGRLLDGGPGHMSTLSPNGLMFDEMGHAVRLHDPSDWL